MRRVLSLAAGTALTATGVIGSAVLTAEPAAAAAACPANYSCFYSQTAYQGSAFLPAAGCTAYDLPFPAYSVHNYGHGTIWAYDSAGHQVATIAVGASVSSVPGIVNIEIGC